MSPRAKVLLMVLGIVMLAVVTGLLTARQGAGVRSPLRSTHNTDAQGCEAFFELLEQTDERRPVRLQRLYDLQDLRGMLVVVGPLKEPLQEHEARLIEGWVRAGNGLLYFVGAEEPARASCALERRFVLPADRQRWEMVQYAAEETAMLAALFPTFRSARLLSYKAPLESVQPLGLKGVPLYRGPGGTVVSWDTLGRGQVIVCLTSGPIQNQHVNRASTVHFLLCAVGILRPPGGAVIFDEVHQGYAAELTLASLFSLPGVLAAALQLAVCGVLYVWMAGRRMGPPAELPAGERRTTRHYLGAAGLLYRERCAPGEVASAYGAFVLRTLARRFGLSGACEPALLASILAQRTSVSAREIENVFARAAAAVRERTSEREAALLIRKLDGLMQST